MNSQQAKAISLVWVLAQLGFEPVRQTGNDVWFFSPFRAERTPSFKVNASRNIWFDHGDGCGGNVLDFLMRFDEISSVSDALAKLDELARQGSTPEPAPAREPAGPSSAMVGFEQFETRPLHHPVLLAYARRRGINPALAQAHLDEAHYTRQGRPYFALAFRSDRGGYELRNAYFKGCAGPKDVTLRANDPGAATLFVFEGFFDYLSALTLGIPVPNVLVLNSTALGRRAIELTRRRSFQRVELYLDWDQGGQELVGHFQQALPDVDVHDCSPLYAGSQDLNEYLATGKSRLGNGGKRTVRS